MHIVRTSALPVAHSPIRPRSNPGVCFWCLCTGPQKLAGSNTTGCSDGRFGRQRRSLLRYRCGHRVGHVWLSKDGDHRDCIGFSWVPARMAPDKSALCNDSIAHSRPVHLLCRCMEWRGFSRLCCDNNSYQVIPRLPRSHRRHHQVILWVVVLCTQLFYTLLFFFVFCLHDLILFNILIHFRFLCLKNIILV